MPNPGETRTYQGETRTWNGSRWEPVQEAPSNSVPSNALMSQEEKNARLIRANQTPLVSPTTYGGGFAQGFAQEVGEDKGKMSLLGGLLGGTVGFPGVGAGAGRAVSDFAEKFADPQGGPGLAQTAVDAGTTALGTWAGGKVLEGASYLPKAAGQFGTKLVEGSGRSYSPKSSALKWGAGKILQGVESASDATFGKLGDLLNTTIAGDPYVNATPRPNPVTRQGSIPRYPAGRPVPQEAPVNPNQGALDEAAQRFRASGIDPNSPEAQKILSGISRRSGGLKPTAAPTQTPTPPASPSGKASRIGETQGGADDLEDLLNAIHGEDRVTQGNGLLGAETPRPGPTMPPRSNLERTYPADEVLFDRMAPGAEENVASSSPHAPNVWPNQTQNPQVRYSADVVTPPGVKSMEAPSDPYRDFRSLLGEGSAYDEAGTVGAARPRGPKPGTPPSLPPGPGPTQSSALPGSVEAGEGLSAEEQVAWERYKHMNPGTTDADLDAWYKANHGGYNPSGGLNTQGMVEKLMDILKKTNPR